MKRDSKCPVFVLSDSNTLQVGSEHHSVPSEKDDCVCRLLYGCLALAESAMWSIEQEYFSNQYRSMYALVSVFYYTQSAKYGIFFSFSHEFSCL